MTTREKANENSTGEETLLSTSAKFPFPMEEPELGSISFQKSLRFFQEQLIINSASSSRSSTPTYINPLKIRLHTLGKNPESHDALAESLIRNVKESEINFTSSKIPPIPTVETILESVRILRAIQRSQAQRGSIWTLECEDEDILDPEELHQVGSILDLQDQFEATVNSDCCSAVDDLSAIAPQDGITTSENQTASEDNNLCPFWPNTITTAPNKSDPNNSSEKLDEEVHPLLSKGLDSHPNILPSTGSNNDPIILKNTEDNLQNLNRESTMEFPRENFQNNQSSEIECQNHCVSSELQESNYNEILTVHLSDVTCNESHRIIEITGADTELSLQTKIRIPGNEDAEISHEDLISLEPTNDTSTSLFTRLQDPNCKEYDSGLLCLDFDGSNIFNFRSEDNPKEFSNYTKFSDSFPDDMTEDYLSCSSLSFQEEQNSAKMDNGDRSPNTLDSGIGMEIKSMSISPSPSIPCHREELEIPSWSESSHYDSAEGSPYVSFSDVAIAMPLPPHLDHKSKKRNQKPDDPSNSINVEKDETLACASFDDRNSNSIYEGSSNDTDVDFDNCSSSLGDADNASFPELSENDHFHSIYHQEASYHSPKPTEDIQSDRMLETFEDCAQQVVFKPSEVNNAVISMPIPVDGIANKEGNGKFDSTYNEDVKCDNCVSLSSDTGMLNRVHEKDANNEKSETAFPTDSGSFIFDSKDISNDVTKTESTEIVEETAVKSAEPVESTLPLTSQIINTSDISDVTRVSLVIEKSTDQLDGLYKSEDCQNNTSPKIQEEIDLNRQSSEETQLNTSLDTQEKTDLRRQNSNESQSSIFNDTCVSKAECTLMGPDVSLMEDGNIAVEGEDPRPKKTPTSSWDPTPLLKHLYQVEELPVRQTSSEKYSGVLDILSLGTFASRGGSYYVNLVENELFCYETTEAEEPTMKIPLQYGKIEVFENNVMVLDNRRGRNIHMKFKSENEMQEWKAILELHCFPQNSSKCVEPVHYPLKSHKNIIIIDLGSCSTRAGILMDQPTLPHVFFPTVCATNKTTFSQMYGMEALLPEVRQSSILSFPVRTSAKVNKFTMDIEALKGIFQKIYNDLSVDPKDYTLQVCLPRGLCTNTQTALLKLLLEDLGAKSVSLTRQALLTLYAYNASTGIVVDIGDRMDILTVVDGFIIEKGVSRLPYGGQRVIHHMKHSLAQKHISLSNEVESLVVQYIMENLCYISEDYEKELQYLTSVPEGVKKSVPLYPFFQGDNILQNVTLDSGRFQTPEGLFNSDLWGVDFPGLHKLVHQAIQCVGVDVRRRIAESIFVSGGVTLMPGFVERLETEVSKLTLPRIKPQIHASPYRYHMAYLGACQLALSEGFPQVCVTAKEWSRSGPSCLRKWHL